MYLEFYFQHLSEKTPTSLLKQDRDISDMKWWAELHNKKRESFHVKAFIYCHTDGNGHDAANL